jgi:hypothetical protein
VEVELLSQTDKERTNMRKQRTLLGRLGFISALLGAMGCAQMVVTRLPKTVSRIAVLPPYRLGAAANRLTVTESELLGLPSRTIESLLAQQARAQLASKRFDVIEPSVVRLSTKDRVPTSQQMAAQIVEKAKLEAAALYIEVRRWEPMPSDRGMKADGVIVALDVIMVDPKTGAVLWQVHRPSRPVPLYGVVLTGQANVFVAETVMKEIFAQLESKQPGA